MGYRVAQGVGWGYEVLVTNGVVWQRQAPEPQRTGYQLIHCHCLGLQYDRDCGARSLLFWICSGVQRGKSCNWLKPAQPLRSPLAPRKTVACGVSGPWLWGIHVRKSRLSTIDSDS